jgi:WD40 repeat protein
MATLPARPRLAPRLVRIVLVGAPALAACSQPPPLTATRVLELTELKENLHAVALAPDASWLVTADTNGELAARDVPSGEERWRVAARPKGGYYVDTIAFDSTGEELATAGSQLPNVAFRDASTGEVRFELPIDNARALLFHPMDAVLVVGAGRSIHLVDAESHEVTRVVEDAHMGDSVSVLAFSGDGLTLASGSQQGLVRLWDWPAMTARASITMEGARREPQTPASLALTRDGKRCAANSLDGDVFVWDFGEKQEKRRFKNVATAEGHRHVELRGSLAFLEGGAWLLAPAMHDTGMRLLDAESGDDHPLIAAAAPYCKTMAIGLASGHLVTIHPKLITGQGPDGIEVWKLAKPAK